MEPNFIKDKKATKNSKRHPKGRDTPPEGSTHPLQNIWKFWYLENQKEANWEDNLKVLKKVSTVEEFWSVFNNIKSASEIRVGCSYFFFKDGLKPMWEDEGNRRGGRWLISFEKKNQSRNMLDEKWQEVLLCYIGEAFCIDGEDICGAAIDIRGKFDKISIWTKYCENSERIMKIGKIIKERLQLGDNTQMIYEKHADTQYKSSSRPNNNFVL